MLKLIKKAINKIFSLAEYYLCINWLNPFATIYVNFRSMPFFKALKLPIWIYGRPKLMCLSGSIEILGILKSGMIRFNYINIGSPSNMSCQSELNNSGKIIFHGSAKIRTGNRIVVGYDGILEIGNKCIVADYVNIGCFKSVLIGDYTRIAHRTQIFDSNYHYIANLIDMTVSPAVHPIKIGKGCWICNSNIISGGAIVPNYCVIAADSYVNKDWSGLDDATLLAGVPAKPLSKGKYLINNLNSERELTQFFNKSDSLFKIKSSQQVGDWIDPV